MITLQWIEENLPLELFNNPDKLILFRVQIEQAFFRDLCKVWEQKNYWSFLLSMGPCVELIGYSAIDYTRIALYRAAGKDNDLKKTAQGFIKSEREKGATFQGLIDAVKAKKHQFIRSEFEGNQWTPPQTFKLFYRARNGWLCTAPRYELQA